MEKGAALNITEIMPGLRVQTRDLRQRHRILARPDLLHNRREALGTVEKEMQMRGQWWIRHDDDTLAPYWYSEFDEVPE